LVLVTSIKEIQSVKTWRWTERTARKTSPSWKNNRNFFKTKAQRSGSYDCTCTHPYGYISFTEGVANDHLCQVLWFIFLQ